MSLLSSIQTALTGLRAQQAAMEVTGQNVNNANTPGYHRQVAVLVPIADGATVQGGIGAGVDVTTVQRLQANYLQGQTQHADGQVGYWTAAQGTLQQVQTLLAPSGSAGLSSQLDSFFNAWSQLASNPEDATARDSVLSTATQLTGTLNATSTGLQQLTGSVNSQLSDGVDQVNNLADQLAAVNARISQATNPANPPNALLDQRGQLMQQLTNIAGVTSVSGDTGSYIVSLGGRTLVQGSQASHLQITQGQVTWDDGKAVTLTSGSLAGLNDLRARTIPGYQSTLDTLAAALANGVNNLHKTGTTPQGTQAGNFFSGNTAATITVDPSIQSNSGNIATTTIANASGDGSLAASIAALATQPLIGNKTLNQQAQGMIGQIGNAVSSAQTSLDAQNAVKTQLDKQDSSVSGVNLDEEMANLLVTQRAYDATAHVLSVADQMLQSLIQQLG